MYGLCIGCVWAVWLYMTRLFFCSWVQVCGYVCVNGYRDCLALAMVPLRTRVLDVSSPLDT